MNTKDLVVLGKIASKKFKGTGKLPSDWNLNVAQLEMKKPRELTSQEAKKVISMYKELGIEFKEIR